MSNLTMNVGKSQMLTKLQTLTFPRKRRGLSKFALVLCTTLDGSSCLTTPKGPI